MREAIDSAINILLEQDKPIRDVILNSKNHVAFHSELASMFPVTEKLMYNRTFSYRGLKVGIDSDLLETHRLGDDDFLIGEYA